MKGVLESVLLIRDFVPKLKDFVSKQFVSVLQRIWSKMKCISANHFLTAELRRSWTDCGEPPNNFHQENNLFLCYTNQI